MGLTIFIWTLAIIGFVLAYLAGNLKDSDIK